MKHPIDPSDQNMPTGALLTMADGLLQCPLCNDLHAHVDEVTVIDRSSVVTVKAEATGIATVHHPSGAYPGSRSTVALGVWCEDCGHTATLHFHQHKGMTYVTSEVAETEGIWPDMEDDDE